jgi:uncharacterized protein
MRLLRLRLTNYRGIDESEVQFGRQGLTIVEGPNEVGKTSLGESIRLLFEYLDSSKHSAVKAIKSVTRDAGPEIELEADELGLIYYRDETLELREPLQEQLIMAVPIGPVCRDACQGLCPECGTDQNEAQCDCEKKPFNNKFGALADLKLDKS